jgi:chromosome segregation ATPase
MFSSIFPSVYSILSRYSPLEQEAPIQQSVAGLSSRDRETLVHEVADGLRGDGALRGRGGTLTSSSRLNDNGDIIMDSNEALSSSLDEDQIESHHVTATHDTSTSSNSNDNNINNIDEIETSISQLDEALLHSKSNLETFAKREIFLSVRISKYRRLMEQREGHIDNLFSIHNSNTLSGHEDLENTSNLKEQISSLQAKHQQDQSTLKSVEEIHKGIIVQMEVLRRRISDLEEKREDILIKREECQEFLLAAAEREGVI